uniref:Coat protein n=1 Tax=Red algae totivirus 1 TaxID=2706914 RepID=A0A6J4BT74_9VIRU|nr:coat protein [Red algae totivirus 1]
MASVPVPVDSERSPLSGVVVSGTFSPLEGNLKYRRYGGTVTTTSRVTGMVDVSPKHVNYYVGARGSGVIPRREPSESIQVIEQVVTLAEELHTELSARIRKYINVGPDYSRVDMSAVIYRLSAAMASFALRGKLTTSEIRGDRPVKVRVVSTLAKAMPAEGHVFVPRLVDTIDCPYVFSALSSAINGAGAVCVTDVLEVDPTTCGARIPAAVNISLARGCLMALRILFRMYALSGQGAIAGLAYTKGLHSVVSVCGHTDEGGYMRDVLRRDEFAVPFGGVYADNVDSFTHFPIFGKGDVVGVQALVDGSALKTAGLSALADPLITRHGRCYPTTFSIGEFKDEGGVGRETFGGERREMARQIAHSSQTYAENYVRLLGMAVCGDDGGFEKAGGALQGMMMSSAQVAQDSRHLRNAVVSPYFWVEPSTLFRKVDSSAATREGYGVLAGTIDSSTKSAFPKAEILVDGAHKIGVSYEHRSVRATPGLVHCYMHASDGMGAIVPYSMRPDRCGLVGDGQVNEAYGEDVATRMKRGATIDSYVWKTGSSQIPAPAEFMYTGNKVGVQITKSTVDEIGFGCTPVHTVVPYDHKGEVTVTMTASKPELYGLVGAVNDSRDDKRVRSVAIASLEAVRNAHAVGMPSAKGHLLGVCLDEPGAGAPSEEDELYLENEAMYGIAERVAPTRKNDQVGGPQPLVYVDSTLHPAPKRTVGMISGGPVVSTVDVEGEGASPGPMSEGHDEVTETAIASEPVVGGEAQ